IRPARCAPSDRRSCRGAKKTDCAACALFVSLRRTFGGNAMTKIITRRSVLAGLSTLVALPARAQAAWPDRPLTLVHGFGAGGNADVVGRIIADRLGSRLGQQI